MTSTSLPEPHEQRKVVQLLIKLSKMMPVSAKPAEADGELAQDGHAAMFGSTDMPIAEVAILGHSIDSCSLRTRRAGQPMRHTSLL